ncbi:PREDICTED: ATP-dependent RNA helicase DDX19A-like, partial [Rhagoletis zephyria]|uniref:ATP-dependent RNA helicase DDX19A-like n=1 Tax=Rhagoletis zephyria TaxID=28612 RepID=UPI0008112AC4
FTAVSRRLKEHSEDKRKLPILIFPEGTCINNSCVMMFKKGSFEVGATIYPVAIKYDSRFGDPFWNSAKYGYSKYLLMMMTSWAIVCDVWYLPPMTREEGESAIEFAARVKAEIATKGGLVELDWDGQLKRQKVKPEWVKMQQLHFSQTLEVPPSPPTPAANTTEEEKTKVDSTTDEKVPPAEFSMMRKVLRNKLLHHTQNKVEILQKDPNNPLYSVKSFDELNIPEPLLRGIYDMGFSKPSRIQEAALPILLHTPPTNLIAQSQSGTGKTAAFLLASLYRVKPEVKEPQVIILAPTYELALQTGEVAQQMAKYRPEITIKYVIRGEVLPRGTKLQDHILIGTPGKMIDWSLKYQFFDIKKIRVFVLDEADVMIDTQGLRAQSVKMKQFLPESCQMMLFSATYSDEVMEFARSIIREPVLILKLRVEEQSLDNINQYYIDVSNEQEKYEALTNIFGTISMGQAFIFVETKISASRLVQQLRKDEHSVGLISGDLTVEQRNEALKRFREGQERVIVATNVMARGIDIEQVSLVINYDLPINVETREVDCETYLHRIGRTGRFGKEGLAINFVDGYRSRAMIQVLEEHFGKPIKKLDATDVDEIEKIGNDM